MRIAIEGYISVCDRDKSGNVYQIAVDTSDFRKFIIHNDSMGKHMCQHIQKQVKITGRIIGEYIQGTPIIQVLGYQLL
jgi:hypothetical protein